MQIPSVPFDKLSKFLAISGVLAITILPLYLENRIIEFESQVVELSNQISDFHSYDSMCKAKFISFSKDIDYLLSEIEKQVDIPDSLIIPDTTTSKADNLSSIIIRYNIHYIWQELDNENIKIHFLMAIDSLDLYNNLTYSNMLKASSINSKFELVKQKQQRIVRLHQIIAIIIGVSIFLMIFGFVGWLRNDYKIERLIDLQIIQTEKDIGKSREKYLSAIDKKFIDSVLSQRLIEGIISILSVSVFQYFLILKSSLPIFIQLMIICIIGIGIYLIMRWIMDRIRWLLHQK
ncbi:MAG: hypothetical protein HY738_08100 [Bacteroidia bacterium]|nr:hypothetical protein [Bacteroidia bacterium]